jgi:hypothetical protein
MSCERVARAAAGWIVSWRRDGVTEGTRIARVGVDGGDMEVLLERETDAMVPRSLTFDVESDLVVAAWVEGGAVHMTTLSGGGAGEVVLDEEPSSPPQVVLVGRLAALVWLEIPLSAPEGSLRFAVVDPDRGAVLHTGLVAESENWVEDLQVVAVDDGFAVAWQEAPVGPVDDARVFLRQVRLDEDGEVEPLSVLEVPELRSRLPFHWGEAAGARPGLLYDGERLYVVGSAQVRESYNHQVHVQVLECR